MPYIALTETFLDKSRKKWMLHPHFLITAHTTNTYNDNTDAADASNIGMIEKKNTLRKSP